MQDIGKIETMKGKIALGAAILFLLMQIPSACACISPEDLYSAEVLLNKPGVNYNLRILKNSTDVVDVNPQLIGVSGEVLVYRSHYHGDLRAILYESGLPREKGNYLSVRLTPKTEETTRYRYKTNVEISERDYEPHQNGLNLTSPANLSIPGWTIEQTGSGHGDRTIYVYTAERVDEKWVRVKVYPQLKPKIPQTTIYITSEEEPDKGMVNDTMGLLSQMFYLGENDTRAISKALNHTVRHERKVQRSVFNFTDSEAKEATGLELRWLRSRGVIQGVTDSDISKIRDATEVGRAGYNSRIFYEKGDWISYAESENPMLLRAESTCSFSLEGVQVPGESPSLPEREGARSQTNQLLWLGLGIVIAVGVTVWFYRGCSA